MYRKVGCSSHNILVFCCAMFALGNTSADENFLLQDHTPGQAGAWENLWKKQQHNQRYIRWGRSIYNIWFARCLRPHLSPSIRMLELGCGTASLGLHLAPHLCTYTGIDSSGTAIKIAREMAERDKRTNATFVEADMFDNIAKQEYDLVWSQGLVEHFRDPAKAIKRHMEFCKPEGKVIFSVPARYSYHHAWYNTDQLPMFKGMWPWTSQRFYTKKELSEFVHSITEPVWNNVHITSLRPSGSGISLVMIQL